MPRRQRVDAELVRRGLARSRQQAHDLVDAGRVSVAGQTVTKPATQVELAAAIVIKDAESDPGYASRGAYKLIGALDALPAVTVAGRVCLDAGASTGGFTDVLLRRAAAQVIAVDVGYGQLAWTLRNDPRVITMDRTNVRTLTRGDIAVAPDLVVSDLSFISLRLVIPALAGLAAADADFVLMVKPQFEVGKDRLGSGGVVRNAGLRAQAVLGVVESAAEQGLDLLGAAASPLPGPSGNVEYFVWLRRGGVVTAEATYEPIPAAQIAGRISDIVGAGPQDGLR